MRPEGRSPKLLHEGTLAPAFQVDVVGVEVAFRGDDHDLRHRAGVERAVSGKSETAVEERTRSAQ